MKGGKKTRQTEEEVGRQHQGTDRPGVRQVLEGRGEQRKMEETGYEVTCGAPTTPAAKGKVKKKMYACTLKTPQVKKDHGPLDRNGTGNTLSALFPPSRCVA